MLAGYAGPQLALALDATTLGSRFVVLAISVVYRGCAIPVAWAVLPAGDKRAWRAEWLRLLGLLAPAIPPAWTVIVLADRGLYARWLFQAIVAARAGIRSCASTWAARSARPGLARFYPLRRFAPAVGPALAGAGHGLLDQPAGLHPAGLLGGGLRRPVAGADRPAAGRRPMPAGTGCGPGSSTGFKLIKRGGWQWQRTRMTDPERASRLWLAVAVATLWLVRVGGEAEDTIPESTLLPLAEVDLAPRRQRRATRLRLVSLFRRGWVALLVALLDDAPLPLGRFQPEPWPVLPAHAAPAHPILDELLAVA